MELVIPQANIISDREPVMVNNAPVLYARIQYMGGEIRVPNPNKFNGAASDVRVACRLQEAAKVYRDRDTKTVSGGIVREVKFEGITAAKLAK